MTVCFLSQTERKETEPDTLLARSPTPNSTQRSAQLLNTKLLLLNTQKMKNTRRHEELDTWDGPLSIVTNQRTAPLSGGTVSYQLGPRWRWYEKSTRYQVLPQWKCKKKVESCWNCVVEKTVLKDNTPTPTEWNSNLSC